MFSTQNTNNKLYLINHLKIYSHHDLSFDRDVEDYFLQIDNLLNVLNTSSAHDVMHFTDKFFNHKSMQQSSITVKVNTLRNSNSDLGVFLNALLINDIRTLSENEIETAMAYAKKMNLDNLAARIDTKYRIANNMSLSSNYPLSFSHLNLTNANLNSTLLYNAKAAYSDFSNACLDRAYFWGAQLNNTAMVNTSMIAASMIHVNFQHSNLTNANMKGADITNTNFTDANLTNVNLTNSRLDNSNFSGANLTNVTFFDGIDTTDTKAVKANLTHLQEMIKNHPQRRELKHAIEKNIETIAASIQNTNARDKFFTVAIKHSLFNKHKNKLANTINSIFGVGSKVPAKTGCQQKLIDARNLLRK